MNILKDLTRQTTGPIPRRANLICDLIKAALFLGVAYCGFNMAVRFGWIAA